MTPESDTASRPSLYRQIGQFFHAEETPYGLALVRILLPLALLCAMLPRWVHARELYSTDGATTPLWNSYGWPHMLPEVPGTLAVAFATILVVSLITASLGWCTRASLAISFVLYTYLNLLDATGTMTKYSVIASHLLLILTVSQCGLVWSVDSWRKRRRLAQQGLAKPLSSPPTTPIWPRRLVQLLMGYVYFGAAMTKLHTPAYFSSDQLFTWMLSNVNYDNPVGEYLTSIPAMLVAFAYIAIVWEVLFLFLAWRGRGRKIMIGLGVVFHVMTTLTLGLYIFPMVCISAYFAFVNGDDVRWAAFVWKRWEQRLTPNRFHRQAATAAELPAPRLPRWPVPAAAGFVAVLAVAVLGGVEIEHQLDPYGERRPEGPYALKELDATWVDGIVRSGPERIRDIDVLHNLETGTIVIGGQLANPRKDFQIGEEMVAQIRLNAPHEDMWVECILTDDRDRIVTSRFRAVERDKTQTIFEYPLSQALQAGDYTLVLKFAGREVVRRSIRLHSRANRRAAN
ncbi:MAG: HTTM domain-containing protein [Planctomycetaceae bacterium]